MKKALAILRAPLLSYSILLIIVTGCVSNDFGQRRFGLNRFSIEPSSNAKFNELIDTSAFYEIVFSAAYIEKYDLQNHKSGLQFYDDGKVATFSGIDYEDPSSLDPRKAAMGYYNYSEKGFYIQSLTEIPGGIYHRHDDEVLLDLSTEDTLFIRSSKSATSSDPISTYVKKKLPQEAISLMPDW